MPSTLGRTRCAPGRISANRNRLLFGAALAAVWLGAATLSAQEARPTAAMLLDRLCAGTLRPNEEDRLFALISITVRATIKYRDGVFDPDLIDDAIQDGLAAITAACPQIKATDDAHRLGRAVELARDATLKRLQDPKTDYSGRQIDKASAADLSEELSAQEIDAWLDALPPRRRAMALLQYASGFSRQEMAEALGLPQTGLDDGFRGVKTDLLKFFRAEADAMPPAATGPAMQYRVGGQSLAGLLRPGAVRPDAVGAQPVAPEGRVGRDDAGQPEPHDELGDAVDLLVGEVGRDLHQQRPRRAQ
jgi:DNA-directed RNA polymerase specialized sigma24 family protein